MDGLRAAGCAVETDAGVEAGAFHEAGSGKLVSIGRWR